MKLALLCETYSPTDTFQQKFEKIINTGNLVHVYALNKMLPVDMVDISDDLSSYSAIITTKMIWMSESYDTTGLENALEKAGAKNTPIIPISVGLNSSYQTTDFKLMPSTKRFLEKIAEQNTIGVRGYYTAEILNAHGIKNIQVIGCPSIYLPMRSNFSINKQNEIPKKVTSNFRTFWKEPNAVEIDYLTYAASQGFSFVEQTQKKWHFDELEKKNISNKLSKWLAEKEYIFFDVDEWREYCRQFDFSMGHRMHGNIISLWEGVPALFFSIDARMEELCDFFSLPRISARDFDASKSLEYYYNLADYTQFNKNYASLFKNFKEFLRKNNLEFDLKTLDNKNNHHK